MSNFVETSSSSPSSSASIIRLCFNGTLKLIKYATIGPFILLWNLYRYAILEPVLTLLVYLFVVIPFTPLNWVCQLLFDMDLKGYLMNSASFRNPNWLLSPLATSWGYHRDNINFNNVWNRHSESATSLYLKNLRHGRYENGVSSGIFATVFSPKLRKWWDSSALIWSSNGNMNLVVVVYLFYKYLVVTAIFMFGCVILTLCGFVMTKVVVHPTTFRFVYNKMVKLADVDPTPPVKSVASRPSVEFKSEIGIDDQEELISDKYSSLEYLRNLKQASLPVGTIQEEEEEEEEEERERIEVKTSTVNSGVFASGASTYGTMNSVFSRKEGGPDHDTTQVTEVSEISEVSEKSEVSENSERSVGSW